MVIEKLAYLVIGIGVTMLTFGLLSGGLAPLRWFWLAAIISAAGIHLAGRLLRYVRRLRREAEVRHASNCLSTLAETLVPQLTGNFPEFIIQAAEQLGCHRDFSAVPALMRALEECVDVQRPGWRDVAESLVRSLAAIGDRRSLPLLQRLENVRGIGLIPIIRSSIDSIEPQTSLLRPGSATGAPCDLLLRPLSGSAVDGRDMLLQPAGTDAGALRVDPRASISMASSSTDAA